MQFSSKLVAERIFGEGSSSAPQHIPNLIASSEQVLRLSDMLVKYHFDELQQFLMDSNDRARQAMRGLLIEKLAHLKLPASDENRVRRLRINEAGAMIQKAEKRDRSK